MPAGWRNCQKTKPLVLINDVRWSFASSFFVGPFADLFVLRKSLFIQVSFFQIMALTGLHIWGGDNTFARRSANRAVGQGIISQFLQVFETAITMGTQLGRDGFVFVDRHD